MVVIPMYSHTGQGEALVIVLAVLLYVPVIAFFLWSLYLLCIYKMKDMPTEMDNVCKDLGGRVAQAIFPQSSDLTEVARTAAGTKWAQHPRIRREVEKVTV